MVTIAGVLDAIPLEVGDAKEGATLAFDAVATFAGMSELEATAYVYDRWGTSALALGAMGGGGWDHHICISDHYNCSVFAFPEIHLFDTIALSWYWHHLLMQFFYSCCFHKSQHNHTVS